ncbi:YraN family protein [Haliangium sp.]|uniref:YraN family protein n=1 Tax=Haliangium sp. TaxID=2663208 RepID=UPI003D0BE1E5
MAPPSHISTHVKGQRGEDRAVEYLRAQGYHIVERNYRCRAGEIDIVARDGDALVFVEVRTRAGGERGSALETVTAAKQRRLARVAEAYLALRRPSMGACRFDVVGITAGEITLIRDAFRLGG